MSPVMPPPLRQPTQTCATAGHSPRNQTLKRMTQNCTCKPLKPKHIAARILLCGTCLLQGSDRQNLACGVLCAGCSIAYSHLTYQRGKGWTRAYLS